MTNSDSGNRPAHRPGDRVRIRHNPKHDHSYSAEQSQARQALGGQIGSIRERTVAGAYRVATAGTVGRGAWFDPSELEPIVLDADGLPVGGTDAPPVDRPVPGARARVTMSDRAAEALAVLVTELGAGYDASQAGEALRSALTTANAEAQGWHEAAQDARQEAREARDAAAGLAASVDALRGKLGAAAVEAEEAARALVDERGARQAAEAKLADVAQAWSEARDAWRSGDAARRHRAEEAVDRALGGAAVKPAVEQRMAEIEARLTKLESGK